MKRAQKVKRVAVVTVRGLNKLTTKDRESIAAFLRYLASADGTIRKGWSRKTPFVADMWM